MMWLKLIPNWLKVAAGALVAVVLAFVAGDWSGARRGATEAENDALKRDTKAVQRRDTRRRTIERDSNESLINRITGPDR